MSRSSHASRKRPRPHSTAAQYPREALGPASSFIPQTAYIQAHEAQLIYGADAADHASAVGDKNDGSDDARRRGARLIPWAGSGGGVEEGSVWADRYDILHLVPYLPETGPLSAAEPGPSSNSTPSSSSSWDSLPSDLEETFYLSDSDEIAAYERSKRQRWVEALRERRLAEREAEDSHSSEMASADRALAGQEAEEEPPDTVLGLMKHTASALVKSPNPHVLEMRILANHGTDETFAFLRGKWAGAWERIKREAVDERDPKLKEARAKIEERGKEKMKGLMGGYESSEDEAEDAEGGGDEGQKPGSEIALRAEKGHPAVEAGSGQSTEDKQREKRLRALEWKRKRAQAADADT